MIMFTPLYLSTAENRQCKIVKDTGQPCADDDSQEGDPHTECETEALASFTCFQASTVYSEACKSNGSPLDSVEVRDDSICEDDPEKDPDKCCMEKTNEPCVIEHYSITCTTSEASAGCPTQANPGATVTKKYCQQGEPAEPEKVKKNGATYAHDC
jgi:hypothetical protein